MYFIGVDFTLIPSDVYIYIRRNALHIFIIFKLFKNSFAKIMLKLCSKQQFGLQKLAVLKRFVNPCKVNGIRHQQTFLVCSFLCLCAGLSIIYAQIMLKK